MLIQKIPVADIEPNPRNPRRTISTESIHELAESIKSQGLLQPITVRKVAQDKKGNPLYQIVLGERRWRASELAELEEIDCIVRDMTDREVAEAMLVENLQRVDVDPIEEARYVESALSQGMTCTEVGARLGKSAKWVATRIQIASMDGSILDMLKSGSLGISHLQLLAQVKDPELRIEMAQSASSQSWTLADLREEIERNQRKLSDAPWKMDKKIGECPKCLDCQERSDWQRDLFGGEKGSLCLAPKCWAEKLSAWKEYLKEKFEKAGRVVAVMYSEYDESCVKNSWSGYTNDEEKINQIKESGAQARVVIFLDGTHADVWNVIDEIEKEEVEAEDSETGEDSDVNEDSNSDAEVEQEEESSQEDDTHEKEEEDPEEVSRHKQLVKDRKLRKISEEIIQNIIIDKISAPDETIFIDCLADAIIEDQGWNVDYITAIAGKDESGTTRKIRNSKDLPDFQNLRKCVSRWIVETMCVDETDLETFSINAEQVQKQAEKIYEEQFAQG